MKSSYNKIGNFIQLVDVRNRNLSINTLLGLSIDKIFIPSVANTVGSDMANYKIIQKGQFACSLMQVRRDKKIPVAMLQNYDKAIISPAYPVFEIKDTNILLPEYLMMWMSRSEFDRESCFYAVGGVRGSLEWDDFCNMELPIPSIEKQREIVREYNSIVERIKHNEQLNQKLEETVQAIYKRWFVDFEFPISKEYALEIGKPELEGKPYRTSCGEMVWNDELNLEIPLGWKSKSFTDIFDLCGGGTPSTTDEVYWNGNIPFFTPKDVGVSYYSTLTENCITQLGLEESSTKLYPKDTVFVTARGTVGNVALAHSEMAMNQSCYAVIGKKHPQFFVHQHTIETLKLLSNEAIGGVFGALVTNDFKSKIIIAPINFITERFSFFVEPTYNLILLKQYQINTLLELKNLLFSKMTQMKEFI